MTGMGHITVKNMFFSHVSLNHPTVIFQNFSIEIEQQKIVVLLGPSGCGKSTFLNLIAGFIFPNEGSLLLDAHPIHTAGPDRGIVFQNHNLFPWKTVRANIEFGLRMNAPQYTHRKAIVEKTIHDIGLAKFEEAYPAQLSGGMLQRVALARAIVNNPMVLLMDEPFGSLDAVTRSRMRNFFLDMWHQKKMTVILVTHDIDEALLLGDRVVLLSKRPAQIIEDVTINHPRPVQEEYIERKDFRDLKLQLTSRLFEL